MKRFLNFISLLTVAMTFTLFSRWNVLPVSASEPTNFYARYSDEDSKWYIQRGTWDESSKGIDAYYLNNGPDKIKDGDVLAIMPGGSNAAYTALVADVRLSNLTVARATALVKTKGIDNCYVLGDSFTSITGDVTNAFVYDKTICTFVDNIGTLTIYNYHADHTEASLSAGGKVDHLIETAADRTLREIYNITAGKLYYDKDGILQTKSEYYSLTPPVEPTVTPSPAAAPSDDSYIVKKGDTLSRIAKANGMSLRDIVTLNPQIKNINLIRVGQKINLK